MPGLTSGVAECLNAGDDTFIAFFDPVVEAMMASVMPIIEPLCIVLFNPPDIAIALELAVSIGLDFPDIALNPLILFEMAGIDLPNILLNLDLEGIAIDLGFSINAAIQLVINMLLIPINIVIGWAANLPDLPAIPTISMLVDLMVDFGFDPNINLECVAEIILIPMEAVGAILGMDDSFCP